MSEKHKRIVIDGRAFDIPLRETRPTVAELLLDGTKSEVMEALYLVGMMLKARRRLPADLADILSDALIEISDGKSPSNALGLNRKKRYGVRYCKVIDYLVEDLGRQGLSQSEARDMLDRLDPDLPEIRKPDRGIKEHGDRVRRRLSRGGTQ